MRRVSLAILVVAGWLCLSVCDQQTRGPDWTVDVGPDQGVADADDETTEEFEGPVCGDGEPIWPSEGAGPKRTFRAPVEGPDEASVLWSAANGEAFNMKDRRLGFLGEDVAAGALRVTDATVTSTGAILLLSAPRLKPREADQLALRISLLEPDGDLAWSQGLPVTRSWLRVSDDQVPTRMGAMALVDDCRLAVRSANKVWTIDIKSEESLSTTEMFLDDRGESDISAREVSLQPWTGNEFTTAVVVDSGEDSKNKWRYQTQISKSSRSPMQISPALTVDSGNDLSQHLPASPVISRPSTGQIFVRDMEESERPGDDDILRALRMDDSVEPESTWKQTLIGELPNLPVDLYRTQVVAASQSKVFLFAGGEDQSQVFGALSAEDGRVLWERRHPYRPDDFQVPFSGVRRPDIVVDPRGRPVLGYGNSLIAFGHDGRIRWTKDMPDRREGSSQTMAMDSDGTLYVASLSDQHLIRAFDSQGNQLFKTSLPDRWTYPQLLAIGKDGMLIVEALKVEEVGDQWEIQSRIFALGDGG
jgi:hypothetical protein